MNCSEKLNRGELLELIAWGRAELSRVGIEETQEECERILMKLLGCPRFTIYLKKHELLTSGVRDRFLAILEKRRQRIPLAYLLKETDFWQETLYVDERCLIPRPETEILVEVVIQEMKARAAKSKGCHSRESGNPGFGSPIKTFRDDSFPPFSFLDIGTGSGAIAIAILRTFRNTTGTLLDISGEALEVAHENLKRYALEGRAKRVRGDLFEPFSGNEKWDLIVSNPPYLSEKDWKEIQEELHFEPRGALDGGKDGLDFYRKIIHDAKDHLTSGGLLALEAGQGQSEEVSTWLQTSGYDNIQRFNDHLGIERIIIARSK